MKRTIAALALPAFFLASCGAVPPEPKTVRTVRAEWGRVAASETAMATVEGAVQSDLAFKAPGRVARVSARPGQSVKAGEILAELGNEESSASVAGLSAVLSEMSAVTAGARTSVADLEKMRAAVASAGEQQVALAEASLSKARVGEGAARRARELSSSTLGSDLGALSGTRETLRKGLASALAAAYSVSRNAREFLDSALGATAARGNANDAFENYLGAKDSATKTAAESAFRAFDSAYLAAESDYLSGIAGGEPSDAEMGAFSAKAEAALAALRGALSSAAAMFENSVAGGGLSESGLADMKSRASSLSLAVESAYMGAGGVRAARQALSDFASGGEGDTKSERSARAAADLKGDAYDAAKISLQEAEGALELAKRQVAAGLAQIDAQLSSARSQSRSAGAQKAQAALGKTLASAALESGVIRAPYDGTVLARLAEPGDVVGAGQPVLSVAKSGPKVAKFHADNPRWKLAPGKTVRAEGAGGTSATGTVSVATRESDPVSKKNYLEILFPEDSPLNVGERVALRLEEPASGPEAAVIPSRALVGTWSVPSVFAVENGAARLRFVRVLADDGSRAMVEGVASGEAVVTEGKDSLDDGDAVREAVTLR